MNIHAASNLDIEKFRKVYALVTGGATDGERAAAKARADKIAQRAGMSLSDVVSKLDENREAPKASNFFSDLFDTPEFKAQQAERNSQKCNQAGGADQGVWFRRCRVRRYRKRNPSFQSR